MCYILVRLNLYLWAIYRDDGGDTLVLHSTHEHEGNARTITRLLNRRLAMKQAGRSTSE